MGCDIHIYPEIFKDGVWQLSEPLNLAAWWDERILDEADDYDALDEEHKSMSKEQILEQYKNDTRVQWEGPWDSNYSLRGRNYNWFSILANVRNGYGFAGVDTGDSFVPIHAPNEEPRGLPDDVSSDVKKLSDSWDSDGHSHSYNTLQELLDYDWDGQTRITRGIVNVENFKEFKEKGEPSAWAGGVSNVEIVSNEVMAQIALGIYGTLDRNETRYYTHVEWKNTYRENVGASYLQGILDELTKYGKPENVRIVFWFDN